MRFLCVSVKRTHYLSLHRASNLRDGAEHSPVSFLTETSYQYFDVSVEVKETKQEPFSSC